METHAFGFRLRANAPEGQKQFSIRQTPRQRPGGPKAISYQNQISASDSGPIAGGATALGTMDEIVVRKNVAAAWQGVRSHNISKGKDGAYEIDLDALIRKEGAIRSLKLGQNDFVYVPQKEPWISNDVSRTVSVVSIILGAALTTLLISEKRKEED